MLPILGRGHGQGLADFPVSMIETKVELGVHYTKVLDIVERGLSKFKAKALYELVDSQIYLASVDLREGKSDREAFREMAKGMKRNL